MAGAASSTTFPVLLGATEDWGLLLLVEGRLIASLACRLDVALAERRGGASCVEEGSIFCWKLRRSKGFICCRPAGFEPGSRSR
jgi:hypothetical protein